MIAYADRAESISEDMLEGFFEGWPTPPTARVLKQILRNSAFCQVAIDTDSEQVVGFVYAISDGVLCAYIPLLEVLPAFRGRAIGSELVRRLLRAIGDLYMVDLVCDPELESFYRPLGFQRGTAMLLRNHDAQGGSGIG